MFIRLKIEVGLVEFGWRGEEVQALSRDNAQKASFLYQPQCQHVYRVITAVRSLSTAADYQKPKNLYELSVSM